MPSLQSLQLDPSSRSHIFAANLSPALAALDNHQSEPPIRVTPKMKGNSGKQKNVFLDDRGFPDQSNEFNSLLHNVNGGTISASASTLPLNSMRSTHVFMQYMMRNCMANSYARTLTSPIWSHLYGQKFMA
jgi:hypothetical protein